jgi:hypothetical protein
MRLRHTLCVCLAFALASAILAMLSHLTSGGAGWNLLGKNASVLKLSTNEVFSNVRGRVSLTYFVSAKDKMPADMKGVEPVMRALLGSIERRYPEVVRVSILDPDADSTNGPLYAARKGVAPITVRSIRFDAVGEQSIWSGLTISFNDFPDSVIPFISAQDLPYVQDLIVAHLQMMKQPAQVRVGLSTPSTQFTEAPKTLTGDPLMTVVPVEFNGSAALSNDLDLFMWLAPERIEERHINELKRFVDSGRSVVIAGDQYSASCSRSGLGSSCRVERSPYDFGSVLRPFGLGIRRDILIDYPVRAGQSVNPFPMKFPASLTDIRALHGFTIGELASSSVTALEPDPDLLNESGFDSQVVATTSADTRFLTDVGAVFGEEAFRRAVPAPKQPWVVKLLPMNPWRGSVLALGSATVFSDVFLKGADNSNALLLKAAAETFASRDRIARLRVNRQLPDPIPEVAHGSGIMWRVFVIGLVPFCLIILGLRGRRDARRTPVEVWRRTPALQGVGAFLGVVVFCLLVSTRPLTPLSLSTASPTARSSAVPPILNRLSGPVEAEVIISSGRYLPAVYKDTELLVRTVLRGLGVAFRVVHPELLAEEQRTELVKSGILPFAIDRVEGDRIERSWVWSALKFTNPSGASVIPQLEPRMLVDLQFLIGAALLRLEQGGRGPSVGLVSDIPRLSGAEAYQDYTQMGQTPPEGSNPFAQVGDLLRRYGYDVRALNPKEPDFTSSPNAVVWLQPRAPVELLPRFADYMAQGGKAFVALQQYKVKQRQYRGRGYDTVYWPEPQSHRFNEYTQLIGVTQMGEKAGGPAEVLMDINQGAIPLNTQVFQRSRYREVLRQEVVRPFLIRAVGSGISSTPMTSRLGALLYIWGNRFSIDEEKVRALGLTVTPLVQTSATPWRFLWDGGWIPEPALSAPTEDQRISGPLPLALEIRGRFPRVSVSREAGSPKLNASPVDQNAQVGELILSGSSEMFTDANLYLSGYQHERFLLNSVAALTYGGDMAEVQARIGYPSGVPQVTREVKFGWRLIVLSAGPICTVLFGLFLHWRRRRALMGV